MTQYFNIPKKYIKKLASLHNIKHYGRDINDVIEDLIQLKLGWQLEHLHNQFRFTDGNLTICKPDSQFPNKSKDASSFVKSLIEDKYITQSQIDTEWQPPLLKELKLCAIYRDGEDVYLKMVEAKDTIRKSGYDTEPGVYASTSSAVIHFGDQVIELRCAYNERNKYKDFIMKILGYGQPYKWTYTSIVTKDEAKIMCQMLSAGLASTQIAIPATVGSLVFNGVQNVDLRNDEWFSKITKAITDLGLPTDDTMDEVCFFKYIDEKTQLPIEVSFEINLKNGGFKFKKKVTEAVYEHVLEAYIYVAYTMRLANQQTAVGNEG
ncbi:hypothetical protein [Bacillus sp. TH25]|uniref:hypothetical protein n=1 Tax=Bacillus sp. TH25 TaxID=2796391 RepID=UPI00191388F0|nr:hypothetical protein [Bacillus sp. TH25]MBK5432011.1 hypothetical protein [Bacillus sp. TH25]